MTFPFEQATNELLASTQLVIDKETAKQRMSLLSKLKAAPGQPNRAMMTHFLMVKKWISDGQTPDDWPLQHMPNGNLELLKLADEIDEFSKRQAKEAHQTPEIVP